MSVAQQTGLTPNDLYRLDAELWFRRYGTLKDKKGKPIRYPNLKPTPVQVKMFAAYRRCRAARKPCMMLVLKPRKDGASTGAQAITYHHLQTFPGRTGAQMGDKIGTSTNLFEMFRAFYEGDQFDWGFGPPSPAGNLADEITLPNGSNYTKETAGSTNAGRSKTPQVANATEVAFFGKPEGGRDPALGFINSASLEGEESLAIWDTTPNGAAGTFYSYWIDKTNDWIKIFVAWFENEEHAYPFESDAERKAFAETLRKDEREEQERFKVTLEQLKWRRWCIKNKCQGSVDKFRQEYPSDDISCWLASGRPRFDLEIVSQMEKRTTVIKPVRGELLLQTDTMFPSFIPDEGGTVEVWEQPRVGCRYLISADSMTGEDQVADGPTSDPDYHSFGCWRDAYLDDQGMMHPTRLVCKHKSQFEVEVAVNVAAAMSLWYGTCMVIPEVNSCGLYLTKKLVEMGIPVFRRPIERAKQGIDFSVGWKTDAVTKKTIIDHLAGLVLKWKPDKPSVLIDSEDTLGQFKTFVTQDKGQPKAMPGRHDDDVMMCAIGLFNMSAATEMRMQVRKFAVNDLMKREGWRRA